MRTKGILRVFRMVPTISARAVFTEGGNEYFA